jgi:hypothetical protein
MVNIRLQRGGPVLRILLATALGLSIGAGVLVHTRTEIISLRYRLSSLLNLEAELLSDVEKLRLEAAALASPQRLEGKALALGLRYPTTGQLLSLPDVASRGPQ